MASIFVDAGVERWGFAVLVYSSEYTLAIALNLINAVNSSQQSTAYRGIGIGVICA